MKKLFIGEKEVTVDLITKTFRGEECKVIRIIEPHKPSSTGRVHLEFLDGSDGEYFPSVIGAEWKEVK